MAFEQEIRDIAYVPRWATARTISKQDVAQHSYFVAVYADQVAELIGWGGERDRFFLLRCALWHDQPEGATGDIVGPVKHRMGDVDEKEMTALLKDRYKDWWVWTQPWNEDIKHILKVADLIDQVMFLSGEASMGNLTMRAGVEQSISRALSDAIQLLPASSDQKSDVADEIQAHLKFHFQTSKVFFYK